MNETYDIEDDIEFFNANFECDNEEQILNLYKLNKTTENNDVISKKIIKEKYNHPLFLNYNYCLFCLERRKTKYSQKNLDDIHNHSNIQTICNYLESQQINLQIPKNKLEKISKRRFIHSVESIQKKIVELNQYYDSDTELYIQKDIDKNESSNAINFIRKLKSEKLSKNLKKSSKQLSPKYEINSFFEDDSNKDNDNNISIKVDKFKSDKLDKSKKDKKRNSKLIKSIVDNKNKSLSKKNVLFESKSSLNKKNLEDSEKNIFNTDGQNLDSKLEEKKKKFSLFGYLTNYFFNSNKEKEKHKTIFENFDENDVQSFQYLENNEKCGICLGEIKDKFTLFCGDFFCRKCIIDLLENSIDNISSFENMKCPKCQELINEGTIKFLLNDVYLDKYNRIKLKIEGLKNKNYVPCPHPDCEGFAPKEKLIDGTLECQNGHIFCNKCLEEISSQNIRGSKHICIDKDQATHKFLGKNKNIRKCPQCKTWVERAPGGCNYFRCNNIWCKFEFCWICGKKYDDSHYRNPLSMCFGLLQSDYQGKMVKSLRIRRIRCILIALLCILILLPIICIFFSFFLIFVFVFFNQLDGKELRNVRLRSKAAHKAFYIFYFLFVILISLALIPFGYMCLVLLIIIIPILIIINKCRKKKTDDF